MKGYVICFLFSLMGICASQAQIKNLELRNKVINLSSYTKNGHITVFIFSIYGCIPCKKVEVELENRYSKRKNFDIYSCNLGNESDVKNWNVYKKTSVPAYWSQIERIYCFPTIYIYGPAGNLSYKFANIDSQMFEEIISSIDNLLNNLSYYNSLSNAERPENRHDTIYFTDTIYLCDTIHRSDTIYRTEIISTTDSVYISNDTLFKKMVTNREEEKSKREADQLEKRLNRKLFFAVVAEFVATIVLIGIVRVSK